MIKKILISIFLILSLSSNVHSAGSSSSDKEEKKETSYQQAVKLIQAAKKFEKKGNKDKANKRYERALKLLVKSNKEISEELDGLRNVAVGEEFSFSDKE